MSEFKWNDIAEEYVDLLLGEKSDIAIEKARELLTMGASPVSFFEKAISPALHEIGRRFETLEIFLPEMVAAAEIVEKINSQVINPAIESDQGLSEEAESSTVRGKVCLASVQGDLHDIGKNMVALMLKVNGFEVVNMGVNVHPQDIVSCAEKEGADIIGLSTLLTSCLPYMKDVVDFLEGKGIRDQFGVIIGGAAPTDEFAESIGVDAHGHSAAEAVRICSNIMETKKQMVEGG